MSTAHEWHRYQAVHQQKDGVAQSGHTHDHNHDHLNIADPDARKLLRFGMNEN